jgi:hypothetical protein
MIMRCQMLFHFGLPNAIRGLRNIPESFSKASRSRLVLALAYMALCLEVGVYHHHNNNDNNNVNNNNDDKK